MSFPHFSLNTVVKKNSVTTYINADLAQFYIALKTNSCFISLLWQVHMHTGLSIIGRISKVIFKDGYLGSFCVKAGQAFFIKLNKE